MSQALLDRSSWERALGPTIRVVGYFAVFVLAYFILYFILLFAGNLIGIGVVVGTFFGVVGPILLVFSLIWSIFKVLDEELRTRK